MSDVDEYARPAPTTGYEYARPAPTTGHQPAMLTTNPHHNPHHMAMAESMRGQHRPPDTNQRSTDTARRLPAWNRKKKKI
jgi:hypothetical protein